MYSFVKKLESSTRFELVIPAVASHYQRIGPIDQSVKPMWNGKLVVYKPFQCQYFNTKKKDKRSDL